MPPTGTGIIRQISPASSVTLPFQIDPETSELAGGVGGWTVTDRPRRLAGLEYTGTPPFTLDLPLWFDKFPNGTIEPIIELCRRWGWPAVPYGDPPVLQVQYATYSQLRFVLSDLTVANTIRRGDGQVSQALITLSLTEYMGLTAALTPIDSVRNQVLGIPVAAPVAHPTTVPVKTTTGQTVTPSYRTVVVKAGDTLWALAGTYLHNSSRWTEIASLNGIRDPRTLQIGTRLKIPAS